MVISFSSIMINVIKISINLFFFHQIMVKNDLTSYYQNWRSPGRFFPISHFMAAWASNFHILLEFLLGSQIKPVSASGAVCSFYCPCIIPFPQTRRRTSHSASLRFFAPVSPVRLRDRPSVFVFLSLRSSTPCNLGFDFTIIYVSIFLPSGMTKQRRNGEAQRLLFQSAACARRLVHSVELYCLS